MFEIIKFKDYLRSYIKKDNINHAYLLETNIKDVFLLIDEFLKIVLNIENDIELTQYKNSPDYFIVETEGLTIKKTQILGLRESFVTKPIYKNKRVFIIKEAGKLNSSSANSLLKFLEDPPEDTVGLLITNNTNFVINTVTSRCQGLKFFGDNLEIESKDEDSKTLLLSFVDLIESEGVKAISKINSLDTKELFDRNKVEEFLNSMIYLYSDVLHNKCLLDIVYFKNNKESIEKIGNNNSLKDINRKINAIKELIERLKFNPNIKLLFDLLIINMTGVDIDV